MLCLITMPEKMDVSLSPYPKNNSTAVPGRKVAASLTGNVPSGMSPSERTMRARGTLLTVFQVSTEST